MITFLFYLFALLAGASALTILFVRNVFYGALSLMACLLSIAALYVLAYAEFVAVTQILIYAGGIAIVILFGIMLTSRVRGVPLVVQHNNLFGAVVAGVALFGLLVTVFSHHTVTPVPTSTEGTQTLQPAQAIGVATLTAYLLPFEVIGILLLIAAVGAMVIAGSLKSKQP